MLSTTRRSAPARFALTGSGLREPRTCDVKASHGYYIGASSSPSYVIVVGVDGDMVRYVDSYSLTESCAARWIFEDLACTALATLKKDEARTHAACTNNLEGASRRLAQMVADMCNHRVNAHGKAVNLADFDKMGLRVSAPKGVDVYGIAKNYGVVGGWDYDANEVDVECDRREIASLLDAGLTILTERLVKTCPTK
jgi:hypothetical protein